MFANLFKPLHIKIYFTSLLVSFIGIALPWIVVDVITDRATIIGVQNIFGIIVTILLVLNTTIFILWHHKKKLINILNLIMGVLNLLLVIGNFIAYRLPVSVYMPGFIRYGIGFYLTLLAATGFIVAGILGLKYEKRVKN